MKNRITSGIYLAVIFAFLGFKIAGVASYSWLFALLPVIALIVGYLLYAVVVLIRVWNECKRIEERERDEP